jgi:hypothetical protein
MLGRLILRLQTPELVGKGRPRAGWDCLALASVQAATVAGSPVRRFSTGAMGAFAASSSGSLPGKNSPMMSELLEPAFTCHQPYGRSPRPSCRGERCRHPLQLSPACRRCTARRGAGHVSARPVPFPTAQGRSATRVCPHLTHADVNGRAGGAEGW